jgi:hypothetical protein
MHGFLLDQLHMRPRLCVRVSFIVIHKPPRCHPAKTEGCAAADVATAGAVGHVFTHFPLELTVFAEVGKGTAARAARGDSRCPALARLVPQPGLDLSPIEDAGSAA